jgi:hypothetical protein
MKTMRKKVLMASPSRLADKEMAAKQEFLMLEKTDYITRQVISIYGGLC